MLKYYNDMVHKLEKMKYEKLSICNECLPSNTQVLSDMPSCHSGGSKTENTALKIIELTDKLDNDIKQLEAKICLLNSAINTLKNKERIIVKKRFIDLKTYEEIQVEMCHIYTNPDSVRIKCKKLEQEIDKMCK